MIEIEKPRIEWVNKDGEQHGRFVIEPLERDMVLPRQFATPYFAFVITRGSGDQRKD